MEDESSHFTPASHVEISQFVLDHFRCYVIGVAGVKGALVSFIRKLKVAMIIFICSLDLS